MRRLEDGILLYHGSTVEVERIDLARCRPGKDFGRGFYVTSSRDQARAFVRLAVKREREYAADATCGYVSVYRFSNPGGLSLHYFEDADVDWLHFVASNRRVGLFREESNALKSCDIIVGKIANDRMARTLQLYVSGGYGEPGSKAADRIAIETLLPNRLEDQYCFRTPGAVAALVFEGSERVDV